MKALNFLPGSHPLTTASQARRCTVRLGDKTREYSESEIVWITAGRPYQRKEKIFTAMIDRVMVKPLACLSREELQTENPAILTVAAMREALAHKHGTPVADTDVVTVIYFSEVVTREEQAASERRHAENIFSVISA